MTVLLLALAGGLGAVARFVLDGTVTAARARRGGAAHPVGTTLINLSGSFLLGLLAGLAAGQVLDAPGLLVLGTGFLGGYTTFSTAAYETVRLAEGRRWAAALVHGLGQAVVATALAALGYLLGAAA
ncbi:fluoride efflux transporter CrcB [Microlunatus spumicola]|uniref:Fluoride-specific ion channel FluC n=1 Tax=Microlunatus spumicola TaxID=81499 RepID=A0ABP6XZ58_9ACTN